MLTKCCVINLGTRRSHEEIQESYQPFLNQALEIRGQLAFFGLKEIRGADISSVELEWKAEILLLLDQEEFATVIEGKMKRHSEEQNVALKISDEALDISNATHVLAMGLLRCEFFFFPFHCGIVFHLKCPWSFINLMQNKFKNDMPI